MDPADRFKVISESMAEKRAQVSGAGALSGLAGLANLLPTSLVTSIARRQAAGMDFATSNLRSSKRPYYMSGAKVEESYAFGPLAGTTFNITAMSYAGRFGIGLFMDPTAIDDVVALRDDVEAAYQELIELGNPERTAGDDSAANGEIDRSAALRRRRRPPRRGGPTTTSAPRP